MVRNRRKSDTVLQLQQEIINQKHSLVWIMNSFEEAVQLIDPYEEGFPILYVNQKFTELTGYPNDEVIGYKQDFLEGIDTDLDASKKIKEVILAEQSTTIEILNYHKDGTPFWKELYLNAVYNNQKELFAYIGITKDVTYKKTNGNRKEIQTRQHTINSHCTMMSFINLDGIIEKSNVISPSFKTINTYIGQHYTTAVAEEDKEKLIQVFHKTIKGYVENAQFRIVQDDQNIIELDILSIPAYSGKKINGVHVIYKNISGDNKTYKLLNDAEKHQTVRKMALSTIDIIKPPLTTLKGFIELSRLSSNLERDYTDIMLTEISRIEQLVKGLSLISQPRIITLEEENLRILLEQIRTFMYTTALMKNIEILLVYHTNKEQIQCDKENLTFALTQLIQNSIEAMHLGGIITIEVTDRTIESLLIRIIDEGDGIPIKELEKVKQPFYTTKNDNLGLGLMICNNIIREHKGTLTLISKKNEGTIAEIILPVASA